MAEFSELLDRIMPDFHVHEQMAAIRDALVHLNTRLSKSEASKKPPGKTADAPSDA